MGAALSDNKSLSTLFFRPLPNLAADAVVEEILENLMSNSIKWQRKEVVELTISRTFLEHPNSHVKEESDALNSRIRRAEHRISIL